MSQETNHLLMMSDADIDYNNLAEDMLKQLALEIEPYIANSALTELWLRQSEEATGTAWKILLGSSDDYLQSTALKVVFDTDRERTLDYMAEHALHTSRQVFKTMVELILYETDFRFELQVAGLIKERMEGAENSDELLDADVSNDFVKVLGLVQR